MDLDIGAGDGGLRDGGVVLDVPMDLGLETATSKDRRYNLLGSLGQNDADDNVLILDTLGLLGPIQEGHIQHKATVRGLAQEVLGVRVPADGEGVLPAAKDGVTGLGDKQGLALAGSEPGRGDVADDVVVVRVEAAGREREGEVAQGVAVGVEVLLLLPLDAVEEGGEVRAAVVEGVPLLEGDVAAPVAHFDVALEVGDVGDGLVELEADLDGELGAGGDVLVRAVGQLRTLLLGELGDIAAARELGVVGDVGRGKLNLRLLLRRRVGGGDVGGRLVQQELFVILADGGRKRPVCGGVVVGDGEGLLAASLQGLGELDTVVLDSAKRTEPVSALWSTGERSGLSLPFRVKFHSINLEWAGFGVLLVLDLEPSHS